MAEDTGVGKFVCETGFARKERNKREGRRCSPFFDSVLPCFVGLFSLSVAEESHSRTDPLQIQRRKKNKTRRKKWRRNIAKEQEISNGTRQNNSGIRRWLLQEVSESRLFHLYALFFFVFCVNERHVRCWMSFGEDVKGWRRSNNRS